MIFYFLESRCLKTENQIDKVAAGKRRAFCSSGNEIIFLSKQGKRTRETPSEHRLRETRQKGRFSLETR